MLSILGILAVTACEDSYHFTSQDEYARLSVNCMPSQADTTWIELTHTIPVAKGSQAAHYDDFMEVVGAHIIYKVNGEARMVGWKAFPKNKYGEKKGSDRYYVAGAHQPGDHVEIDVEAEGYPPVHAATTVPQPLPIDLQSVIRTRVFDAVDGTSRNVLQLTATFTDPAESTDYYALRLRSKHYFEGNDGSEQGDSLYISPKILSSSEPQLQLVGSLDGDFGFSGNYYQDFPIFSDRQINGQTYTLHLDMLDNTTSHSVLLSQPECAPVVYQVQLYRLTPEFYRYVKSINDIDNNELAQKGFSMPSPTYTNVSGGIGIVGGYWITESQWLPVTAQSSSSLNKYVYEQF